MAEIPRLTHQAAIVLGLGDLPSAFSRGLNGVRDTLKFQQNAVTLSHKDAVSGLYRQRIGIITLDDLVLAIERLHFQLQLRRLLYLLRFGGTTRQQEREHRPYSNPFHKILKSLMSAKLIKPLHKNKKIASHTI